MTNSRLDKNPWWRSPYTLAAALAVLLLGFTVTFFQIKNTSTPVHGKILRNKIKTQTSDNETKSNRLANNQSSATVMPSQQTSRVAENRKTVGKEEAFVSVDHLVPGKLFSYEASIPNLAVLNKTDPSGWKIGLDGSKMTRETPLDLEGQKLEYNQLRRILGKEGAGEFTLILLADGSLDSYNSFFLSSPPRFVIDFSGKWRVPEGPELKLAGEVARSVRLGKHSDYLRVVIDLTDGVSQVPIFKESSKGLIVTIRKVPHVQ